jgi:dienelactone hydrolase
MRRSLFAMIGICPFPRRRFRSLWSVVPFVIASGLCSLPGAGTRAGADLPGGLGDHSSGASADVGPAITVGSTDCDTGTVAHVALQAETGLFGALQESHPTPPVPRVPFYSDKLNLLVWQDERGESHPIDNPADWQRRRAHILQNMELVMGRLPNRDPAVALDVQVLDSEKLEKVTRKKITYVASRGDRVPAYLVIPNGLSQPAPAMVCLHGTGGPRGRTAGLGADYPRYALELAERGYVTIAPDYTLLGDNQTDPESLGYSSGTMKGIWCHMRAADLLESLPEVDKQRIGCCGVSLGGHNALFLAAFDPRMKVVVCSSGFDSFADYMNGNLTGWCQKRYMPAIAEIYGKDPKRLPFDFPEVLAAIAPRPLYIHAPRDDHNFKVDSARRCIDAASTVYRLLGAGENLVAVYPPGPHGYPPEVRENSYNSSTRC